MASPVATGQEQDTGKKVGEKLDDLGRTIKKGLQDAGHTIREQFAKTRAAVHNMDLAARIYGRLHWDKCLNTSVVDLEIKDDVVTLRGTVPDAKARTKAVELARDTVGVSEVNDQLVIAAPQRISPASSPGASAGQARGH
jgi:hypothetical protein